jgi:hypothetical protein
MGRLLHDSKSYVMPKYTVQSVLDAFPDAKGIMRREIDVPSYSKVAVSVFPRWLGEENLGQLDCNTPSERTSRDERLLSHWSRIFDETEVFGVNQNGEFAHLTDKAAYIEVCRNHPNKPSDQFQFIAIPELQVLYHEHWDDTNVAWFQNRSRLTPLLTWARDCGLHVLEYDT